MKISQVYEFVNTATSEALGSTGLVQEDLSNIVDIGDQIDNARAYDKYVGSLVNHIGRVIFVNRVYRGNVPSVLMDGWEYGSICEKIQADIPQASENETWELEDGQSYDPNIFYKPSVSAKFFNKRVTFEIDQSFTERQVKMSFSGPEQLNGFISMLYNAVEKSMTVKLDELVMRTINNMIGETIHADYGANSLSASSGVKAVNLLYLYNQQYGTNLAAADALTEPKFIRFASYKIKQYMKRLTKLSTLFNIGGKERFTDAEVLHVVAHADFDSAAEVYLYDGEGQFRVDGVRLPRAETVPYWQGSGTSYAFGDCTKVNITTTSGDTVNTSGILCVLFDRDALGVTNLDKRVTTHYNAKAEFYNNFYKFEAGYFNDFNENFVVFFVA